MAQLRAVRPDLALESVRGNLDTRLRKLAAGQYSALVLAAAGLTRLGWADRIAEYLSPEVMCPAVGQGALAIETRGQGRALEVCSRLEDAGTRLAVDAERAVLASLGGGCQVPIGAHARVRDGWLDLDAIVAAPDGSRIIRRSARGPSTGAVLLGREVGEALLGAGAREILEEVYGA